MTNASERASVRLEAVGDDVEQAPALLSTFYDGSRWASSRTSRSYSYRYAAIGDPTMTLRTSEMQGSIEGDIPPGDDYVVQWITEGSATVDLGAKEVPMALNIPLVFPAHRSFVFGFTDYKQKLVHLNRGLVDGIVAERADGAQLAGVRFDHTLKPSSAAVGMWHDTVTLVSRTLSRGEPNPLLWSELARMTAVALLELCPPRLTERPAELLRVRNDKVAAAVEYIYDHADEPLTPAVIAAAVGVPLRTLHESFNRELGMSPMALVRRVRLERVREELLDLEPRPGVVADVALRWGFAHLGRFSAAYANRFGELPRETLGS